MAGCCRFLTLIQALAMLRDQTLKPHPARRIHALSISGLLSEQQRLDTWAMLLQGPKGKAPDAYSA